jgi:hypothetical protein
MLSATPNWLFLVSDLSIVIDLIMVAAVFIASRNLEKQYRNIAFWSFTFFIAAWFLLTTILAKQGIFVQAENKFSPILPVLLIGFLGSYFLFTKWRMFRILLLSIPVWWIVIIQFSRIEGGIFLVLYSQKLLPPQFALPAGAGDVFIGVSSLFVAWALHSKKIWAPKITRWWCYLGLLDLIIAVTMGALTSPSNLQDLISLPFKPTNLLIGEYPLVMIPIFRVPLAITLHLLALRKLNKQQLPLPGSVHSSV